MRLVAFGILLLAATTAQAEISLIFPEGRSQLDDVGPCGEAGSTRGTVTRFFPGETVTIEWQETIDQPGHYRIAFDDDGDDAFEDPSTPDDAFASTLIDQIPDMAGGGTYRQEITLPETTCETCTLQLVQVKTTSVPYDAFSYQCADIQIDQPHYSSCGGPATTMCCSAGGATGGLGALGVVLCGLALRRRRRAR